MNETTQTQTLAEAVASLTPAEARDEKNTIRCYQLFSLGEIVRYGAPDPFTSPSITETAWHNLRELMEATTVRAARHFIFHIVDNLECSTLNQHDADGSAIRRLAELDRAIESAKEGL